MKQCHQDLLEVGVKGTAIATPGALQGATALGRGVAVVTDALARGWEAPCRAIVVPVAVAAKQ